MEIQKAKIIRVAKFSPEALGIYLERPQNWQFEAGQFVNVHLTINGENISRPYSLATSPDNPKELGIIVKRIPGGKASNFMFFALEPGISLSLSPPQGKFTLRKTDEKLSVFFAAGSGITPVYAMIDSALKERPSAKILLLYANREYEKIILREQLEELEKAYPGLEVMHFLSKMDDQVHFPSSAAQGRLSVEKILAIPKLREEGQKNFYICGPSGFMEMVEEGLKQLKVPGSDISREYFNLNGSQNKHIVTPMQASRLMIRGKGINQEAKAEPGQPLLESILSHGNSWPHSCKKGFCGACRAVKTSGELVYGQNFVLTEEEIKEGQVLLCQSYPNGGDISIEPLEKII